MFLVEPYQESPASILPGLRGVEGSYAFHP